VTVAPRWLTYNPTSLCLGDYAVSSYKTRHLLHLNPANVSFDPIILEDASDREVLQFEVLKVTE
jgi:hypothetical protein